MGKSYREADYALKSESARDTYSAETSRLKERNLVNLLSLPWEPILVNKLPLVVSFHYVTLNKEVFKPSIYLRSGSSFCR